jgi:hypothetical protein
MAFIIENNQLVSFAEYSDVKQRDQRVFDSNEGLSDDVVETALIRATERILNRFRSSDWWRSYWLQRSSTAVSTVADIPALDAGRIKSRANDFTELCVYTAMADYILPQTANFGDEGDDDRAKMGWYSNRAEALFGELITAGDWYDFDDDGTIQSDEKSPGFYNLRRYR